MKHIHPMESFPLLTLGEFAYLSVRSSNLGLVYQSQLQDFQMRH